MNIFFKHIHTYNKIEINFYIFLQDQLLRLINFKHKVLKIIILYKKTRVSIHKQKLIP